jgi:tRNA G18 (ribose-2'-O)-methylase SpoU
MEKEEYNDQVEGRNAVLELLESGRDINKILVANGEKHGSIHKILAIAKERKIIVTEIEKNKLNQIAQTPNNQGVIAIVPPYDYCEVEDILDEAKRKNEKPFIFWILNIRINSAATTNLVSRIKVFYHSFDASVPIFPHFGVFVFGLFS